MAIYNLPNYKIANGFDMPLNMNRANPDPLDNSSVWATYADALNYAKTSPIAYVGQLVTVVNYTDAVVENDTVVTPATASVDVYKIELDANGIGTLVKVNSNDEVANLDTTVQELDSRLDQAETDIGTVTSRVGVLETDLQTANNNIGKANEAIGANATLIETLTGNVGQLQTDIQAVSDIAAANKLVVDQYVVDKENYATKTDVAQAKSDAVGDAKSYTDEQIKKIVTDGGLDEQINTAYDTIKEIAAWIGNDQSGAAKIAADVKAIQDDYLKSSDKSELAEATSKLSERVGTLPAGVTSKTVVEYIKEATDALNISSYAKAADLTTLANERVTPLETKVKTLDETTIPGIVTDIQGIDTRVTELEKIDHEHSNLAVLADITAEKVAGWDDAVTKKHEHANASILQAIDADAIAKWNTVADKAASSDLIALGTRVEATETAVNTTLPDLIKTKVTQTYTEVNGEQVPHRLITPSEAQKLEKLILNADGSVTTGQTVAAGDVQGLAEWITNNGPTHIKNLTLSNFGTDLVTQIESAITEITINGTVLSKADGSVAIPLATGSVHGVVKLGNEFKIAEDSGAMEVDKINVNKLTQTAGEVLQLNGGNASGGFDE